MGFSRRQVRAALGSYDVIDIDVPGLRVELRSYGAALHTVQAPDRHGALGHVHLRLPDEGDYLDKALNPHLGATIGRYANRIAGARFALDGHTWLLDANNGANTLHGGALGWDRHLWEIAELAEDGDVVQVTFRIVSPDGDMGFPGTVTAESSYAISSGRIEMRYRATTDAPTVISMTNHGYWNLDDTDSIGEHLLAVPAERRLASDSTGIPTAIEAVAGSAFDLRGARVLGEAIAATGGLDHCYLPDGEGVRLMGTVHSPVSGRTMRVLSDAPGVQVYSGNNLRPPFVTHQSLSLEAQRLPDAPNQPALGRVSLLPGETYAAVTVLEFTH